MSSETSVIPYKITWLHNPEDHSPYFHRLENIRSHKSIVLVIYNLLITSAEHVISNINHIVIVVMRDDKLVKYRRQISCSVDLTSS